MEVLQRTANRGSISTGGYEIDNSCKFESDGNEYIDRPVGGSDGSSTQHTISCWIKRTELGIDSEPVSAAGIGRFRFESDDTFSYQFRSGKEIITNRKFRDTSAWYHIVAVADSSQATASNRMKLYVNGVQETSFSTATYQDQNQASPGWGKYSTYNFTVGAATNATRNFNGYLADVYYIDGQVLDPTYFGEFDNDTGIWKPKAFTGTFGSLDTYLDFSNASDLGENSGGTTDLNENSVDSSNQATDTPTNNFATFNVQHPRATNTTIAEGGTEMYINSNYQTAVSSIAVSKGKWYAEFIPGSHTAFVGFVDVTEWTIPQLHNGFWLGYDGTGNTMSVSMKGTDGTIYNESNSASGATYGNTDVVSVALDMDNRKAYFAVNGTWVNSGNPATEANPILWYTQRADGTPWTDVITMGITGYTNTYHRCNFGGYSSVSISSAASDGNGYGTFEYAPPSGYYALCTKNLAEYG